MRYGKRKGKDRYRKFRNPKLKIQIPISSRIEFFNHGGWVTQFNIDTAKRIAAQPFFKVDPMHMLPRPIRNPYEW